MEKMKINTRIKRNYIVKKKKKKSAYDFQQAHLWEFR